MGKGLEGLVVFVLMIAILPSFTALSSELSRIAPPIFKYLGPINLLKILWPVLLYFAWTRRRGIPKPVIWIFSGAVLVGTFATGIAGVRCHFPPALVREWFVIVIGMIAAFSFFSLPQNKQRLIVAVWTILVSFFACLDYFLPTGTDWFYAHLFDPETRALDSHQSDVHLLGGVFGFQSMAKLLTWLPWLLMMTFCKSKFERKNTTVLLGIATLATAALLSTSQRGALIGMTVGWVVFFFHQILRGKRYRLGAGIGAALLISLALIPLLVPRTLLKTRIESTLGLAPKTGYGALADVNRDFRLKMTRFSLNVIAHYPLGNACIPEADFYQAGVFPNHAHSLFIHQFRERGWLWGSFHLLLWLAAAFFAWRTRDLSGGALAAGLMATIVAGLVDHPWFVLNHAMILSVFLVTGISRGFDKVEMGTEKIA